MTSRECQVCGRIFRIKLQWKTVFQFNCTPCIKWARRLGVQFFTSMGDKL